MNAFLAKMFVFVIFAMVIVADTSPKHCNALYKMSPKCPDSCRRQSLSFFRTKSHHHYLYHHREYYKKQYFYKNRHWKLLPRLPPARRASQHDVPWRTSQCVALRCFCILFVCCWFVAFLIWRRVSRSECSRIVLQQIMLCECITQNKHT